MAKAKLLNDARRKDFEVRSGLDILKQYIPSKDYTDSLIEHVGSGAPEFDISDSKKIDENRPDARKQMIEKSAAILSYLRDNGYDFSIEADRESGQMKAKIADSNCEIRLLDRDENNQHIGRVYDKGVSYYYSRGTNSQGNSGVPINTTPEMAVDLVRYGLGERVNRINNEGVKSVVIDEPVGTAQVGGKNGYKSHTYTTIATNPSFTTLYSREKAIPSPDSSRSGTMSGDIYIRCTPRKDSGNKIRFRDDKDGQTAFEKAEAYIEDSRAKAVENFKSLFKKDAVDKLAQLKAAGEFEGVPEFSDNKTVADMQKSFYQGRLDIYSNTEQYSDDAAKADALNAQNMDLDKDIDALFGNKSLRSINPINVASYMDSTKGLFTNENNLVSALKIVQKENAPYYLEGDDFASRGFKERMVSFNADPVYDSNGKQTYPRNIDPNGKDYDKLSPFWQNIGEAVRSGLSETGVRVESIAVDENGVIHYEGNRQVGLTINAEKNVGKVVGNIGQVFEPDTKEFNDDGSPNLKKGLIETKFNSDENYYIAPGYTAYVIPPTGPQDSRTYEERTRLRGYEQEMTHAIRSTLRHDIIANDNYDNTAGLNNVYHRIYGDKLSLDFENQMTQEGKDVGMIKAINETSLRRVRFDNCYKDGTSILAKVNAERSQMAKRGYNLYTDNVRANMAVMDADTSKGIFDPINTGTGTNQGVVRYLTSDAVVNADGSITRGKATDCPLVEHEDFRFSRFNPPDRSIMSMMNAMNQSSTARGREVNLAGEKIDKIGVGTAHMALGGYTQDDAFVVSKEFAEANMIRGKDGNMRPLNIGDKICDHSGNKGVISFVTDRNADMSYFDPDPIAEGMTEQQCKDINNRNNTKDLQKRVINVFKDNPSLDVIGAPYTAPSRFNGGTAREMIESQSKAKAAGMPTELNIEGRHIDGGIGYCNWIITDMPVDEKTHIYEHDGDGGRKASGQLVWGLAELGANNLIDEIYKFNNEPTIKTREMMLVTGLDLSETGEIHRGYAPHMTGRSEDGEPIYEQRNEYSVRDIAAQCRYVKSDGTNELHNKSFNEAFYKTMSEDGGFMKLPFPIEMASGDLTPEKLDENGKGTGEYMLPILAGKYRSGRETVDNKLVMHEYTSYYKQIFDAAGKYVEAERSGSEKTMLEAESVAQRAYKAMVGNITERYFEGKHNIFKDEVMRKQLHGTATAVISPDGSLDLDEISLTATTAQSIGVNVDDPNVSTDPIIVWRDPLLSGGGIRNFRPRIIENRPGMPGYDERNPLNNQIGIAMNPSSAASFEGDFDGDSVGLYEPQTKAGIKDAREKLSFPSQILNRECISGDDKHDMYFQDGLDVAAGKYYDGLNGGDVASRMEKARDIANEAYANGDRSVGKGSANQKAFEMFNEAMHDAQNAAFGQDVISYASPEEHIKSLMPMIKSGAKGSAKKIVNGYAPYFGAKFTIDENYNVNDFEDLGTPYVSDDDRKASLAATHAKAYLTGVAGKFSQHAEMMALNSPSDENEMSASASATALTHPVTQSVMQLKHNSGSEITHKIDMTQNVAPALWAGYEIEKCVDQNGEPSWGVKTDKEGNSMPADPEKWKQMFHEFYTDKAGMNVPDPNPKYVDTMANIMTVEENGKRYVKGFDSKTKEILPTEQPLTRMAYEGNFNTLCAYADKSKNGGKPAELFSGTICGVMAPKTIRDNLAEKAKADTDPSYSPVYKSLSAKDTQFKNGVETPSVDMVDRYIQSHDGEDIHMSAVRENEADIKAKVPQPSVVAANDDKSFTAMSYDEKMNVYKSVAEKCHQYTLDKSKTPQFTEAEAQAYNEAKQQSISRSKSNGTSADPEAFAMADMYMKARRSVAFDKLSNEEFENVAKSVAGKYVEARMTDGKKPVFTDVLERECDDRLVEQNNRVRNLPADERVAFVQANPDQFRERITCTRIKAEIEAAYAAEHQSEQAVQTAKSSGKTQKQAPAKDYSASALPKVKSGGDNQHGDNDYGE